MRRTCYWVLLALVVLLLASPAAADRLGMHFKATVSGKDQPAIVIQPTEAIKIFTAKLERSDGKRVTLSARNVRAGKKHSIIVRQASGSQFTYQAKFEVKWASGLTEVGKASFKLTRMAKLKLKVNPQDVDLDARSLSFTINNPAKKAQLTIVGDDGKPLKKVEKKFGAPAAGTALQISWPKLKGAILYMELRAYDVAGFWQGVRLTPVHASIPHDDVEFASGKWDIRTSEEPKLKETLKALKASLGKFTKAGVNLQVRLYVAGYTDTVGTVSANQTLSNNRARSISSWFRRNGIKIPIYYQGYGEKVLAKQTPDETSEATNRRAIYILASQTPPKSRDLPKQNWSRL